MFERPDRVLSPCGGHEPLYVITSVFNSVRYKSRWKLFCDFERMVEASGAQLWVVEVAFADREFAVTQADNPQHLQLRTNSELWHKESALQLLIQRLPPIAKYIAWVDADVSFARGDWANEIVHALQHYDVVQPWTEAVDMSPKYEMLDTFKSFAWCLKHDEGHTPPADAYSGAGGKRKNKYSWHPGFACAWRRDALDAVGGLMDWSVLGNADSLMWHALADMDMPSVIAMGTDAHRLYEEWRARARDTIKGNVGYIDGLLLHYWHGKKRDRRYRTRTQILIDAKFNVLTDIYRDSQGLWQMNRHNTKLRDGIRDYMRTRNEDSVDTE